MWELHQELVVQKSAHRLKTYKAELGQFMTPPKIASFMASMFPSDRTEHCHLLDAGAGMGSLTCAFLDRNRNGELEFGNVEVTAFEVDEQLYKVLSQNLQIYQESRLNLFCDDYIDVSAQQSPFQSKFSHVILNPPYKKIKGNSSKSQTLRSLGVSSVNFYSAFVSIAISQMIFGGHLVAIVPRSFCNGPYYRGFRDDILAKTAIRRIHVFESRSSAFKDDGVLQENVIIHLQKGVPQGDVKISCSNDGDFSEVHLANVPFERIVHPNDLEKFIHIPLERNQSNLNIFSEISFSLTDLDLQVSTGPVVDFRVKDFLLNDPTGTGFAPLIYPLHQDGCHLVWPRSFSKKPNAIEISENTIKQLYPRGNYCIVRRFSSKEEKRRIFASFFDAEDFSEFNFIGFENHVNVFHRGRGGISADVALGLTIFLNTSFVDSIFRQFNGLTQVNVTDLKKLKYPSISTLERMGKMAMARQVKDIEQREIDEIFAGSIA